jgi:hypothetical protein
MHGAPSTTVGALDGDGVGLTVGDAGGDLLVDEGGGDVVGEMDKAMVCDVFGCWRAR